MEGKKALLKGEIEERNQERGEKKQEKEVFFLGLPLNLFLLCPKQEFACGIVGNEGNEVKNKKAEGGQLVEMKEKTVGRKGQRRGGRKVEKGMRRWVFGALK